MITTQDIINLGWKHVSTASNGGSKHFQRGKELYIIESHADNFIYKKENNPKLYEIEIKKLEFEKDFKGSKWILLYKDCPSNVDELRELINNLCV